VRRLLPLVVLVLVPVPSTALADGCPPSSCGISSSAPPGSGLVFVRLRGQRGSLQAYGASTGTRRFTLPRGVLSADSSTFVSSAAPQLIRTTVVRYDAATGKIARGWSLPGHWDAAAISADGRHHVLANYRRRGIVLRSGGLRAVLPGTYDVEALSPDGHKVFLVHWKRNGYDLRQLDLVTHRLAATRLAEPDEKMSGTAVNAVATRDGHWLLTLYSKPDGHSFIHALDLRTALAHCIDLTLTGDFFALGSTALALSPDEGKLYLANPYLGLVTTVDLAKLEMTRVVRFARLSVKNVNMLIGPSAALTPNGRMLAFTGQKSVWLYDTVFGIVRQPASVATSITGVGFRPDGRRLLALQRHGPPVFLDAATGERR
jgi:hypothetical protein